MYTRSHTFHVSKIIEAPLQFAYKWCTDYRESDPRILGSKNRRKILFKSKNRVVYVSLYVREGKQRNAVNVVTLHPPAAWHLDFISDDDDELGDYHLTRLGPKRTRLEMKFAESYKMRNPPTKAADIRVTSQVWDKYVTALEKDYARQG
jgi:hypothetical protein